MGRWIGSCLLLLLLSGQIAYGINAVPAHTIFYLPANSNNDAQAYIEFYWQIDPNSITFREDTAGIWRSKVKTEILITTDTGVITHEKYFLQTTPASSLIAARLQNIMDMHRYMVPEGIVRIKLLLTAYDNKLDTYEYIDTFEVPKHGKTFYSQLQLIDTSYKTDLKDNIYLKNGNLQIPVCFNFLDDHRSTLNYYVELNGANNISADQLPLTQTVTISKKEYDYPVARLVHTDTLQPAAIIPVLGRFKTDVLPSGNYYLNVVLTNNKEQELTRQSLFFQRSNTHPKETSDTTGADSTQPLFEKVSVFDLGKTFVSKYNIAQQKAIIKMLKPVANETELISIESFITRPDETYMKYFIYNFWKSRTPADPEKGWLDYTEKVKEVNKMFGSKRKPGYETERGFYYLKYGPPDQRYVVTAEEGTLPYEVWQYNAPGKQSYSGSFLFYNPPYMVNEYILLHSTVSGEMRNNNWRASLYTNGSSTNNLNSRAEQVFQNR
ncbi:MAG: GWxTD domain-containing protein [Chitinophagales bacterium]|nr:GWxTD domain-containing protein [Chitinophagales bacterium]